MTDRQEMTDRNRIRRQMALASMILVWVIVIAFLFGLTSDDLAARVEKVWAPFVIIFPALIAQVMHYAYLGSKENQTLLEKD